MPTSIRARAVLLGVVTVLALAGCTANASVGWTFAPAPVVTPPPASPSPGLSPSARPETSAGAGTAPPGASPASAAPTPSGTAASPGASTAAQATGQTFTLTEWKVDGPGTLKAGTSSFAVLNAGTVPHELLVFKSDLAPSAYPIDGSGHINEDDPGISLLSDADNIDPGASQPRTVDLAPGTYLFVCNIPGHFKLGMFAVVTVAYGDCP